MMVSTSNPTTWEMGGKNITVQAQPQKHESLSEKQTKNKKDWGPGSRGTVLA
jgi:hypothetical protein